MSKTEEFEAKLDRRLEKFRRSILKDALVLDDSGKQRGAFVRANYEVLQGLVCEALKKGIHNLTEIRQFVQTKYLHPLSDSQVRSALRMLEEAGKAHRTGSKRTTKYYLAKK